MLPHKYVSASTASICLCHTFPPYPYPFVLVNTCAAQPCYSVCSFLFRPCAFNIATFNRSDKQPNETFTFNSPTPDRWHRIPKGCSSAEFAWVLLNGKQEMPGQQSSASLNTTLIPNCPRQMQNDVSGATNDAIVGIGPLEAICLRTHR